MIQPERVRFFNDMPLRRGRYVLYWMQAAQRAEGNHALEYAIRQANDLGLPVVAVFGLAERYPEANERHYAFMLEGLRETAGAMRDRGISLAVWRRAPDEAALEAAGDAALIVTDWGYLRIQKQWRARVAREAPCRLVQVETDVVVPLDAVSAKEEYAARTIRPRIHRLLESYLVPLEETLLRKDSLGLDLDSLDVSDPAALLARLDIDRSVGPVDGFRGGTSNARRLLQDFIAHKLDDYAELRNHPDLDCVSHMSPYLHFGQVSPLTIALEVAASRGRGMEAYLEELIVRRELSMNFVHHNADYDTFDCLPAWAVATLDKHRGDRREYLYSTGELERGETHDPYWNAAQQEMVATGKMHNYMRMYWGKKILEWSETPEEAFRTALYLNNKYELDGRDANSFAGVAWCFGKHDRPWRERPLFGTVRYMNAAGLERKLDMAAYLRKVQGRG